MLLPVLGGLSLPLPIFSLSLLVLCFLLLLLWNSLRILPLMMKVLHHLMVMIPVMTLVMVMAMKKIHILLPDHLLQLCFHQMFFSLETLSLLLKDLLLRLRIPLPPMLNAGNLILLMALILQSFVSSWFNVHRTSRIVQIPLPSHTSRELRLLDLNLIFSTPMMQISIHSGWTTIRSSLLSSRLILDLLILSEMQNINWTICP